MCAIRWQRTVPQVGMEDAHPLAEACRGNILGGIAGRISVQLDARHGNGALRSQQQLKRAASAAQVNNMHILAKLCKARQGNSIRSWPEQTWPHSHGKAIGKRNNGIRIHISDKKDADGRPPASSVIDLLLLDCTNGASIGAGTALDALIRIDDVGLVALGDDAQGAGIGTGTAADASTRNLVCHHVHLHYFMSVVRLRRITHPL